jgi:hypothetical protein
MHSNKSIAEILTDSSALLEENISLATEGSAKVYELVLKIKQSYRRKMH